MSNDSAPSGSSRPSDGAPRTTAQPMSEAEAFAERLSASFVGAFECFALYAGDRLGWLNALAERGPMTAAELAAVDGTDERYGREWLEMLAVGGILVVDEPAGDAASRRFGLTPGAREVLTDSESLCYLGPFPRLLAGVAERLPDLLRAYRAGGGVSWNDFGDNAREAQAALNRPWFDRELAPALASVSDLHTALTRPQDALLDVGCGFGWSTLALARAYPQARVVGVDIDAPSVAAARAAAAQAGLDVEFRLGNAAELRENGPFDAVFLFECVHDLADPVGVLRAAARALAPEGVVIVVDEAVDEHFRAPGTAVDRLMYGCSLFVCLPDGRSGPGPSAATGTVMRPSILSEYGRAAGLTDFQILPIEGFGSLRFYRLAPRAR